VASSIANLLTLLYSTSKNADDVVITLAIRTPLTKGGKGGFKDTPLDAIVVKLLKEVTKRINFDPALVEDVSLGNVSIISRPVQSFD
jgi:acetyl-CoA acyltransferase 1